MSTDIYYVSKDDGNFLNKGIRDGKIVVMRNVAARYDGADDALRALGLFGAEGREPGSSKDEHPTDSAVVQWGGEEWVVGELAYDMGIKSFEPTTYSRYGTEEWYAIIAASFVKLYSKRSGVIALTFSMPVSQVKAGRHREVKEMLAGAWEVGYEGKNLHYEVPDDLIDMVPEGFGSLAYLCLSEDGKRFQDRSLAESRVVVLDFGGYTVGVTTYDMLSIGSYNNTIETGLIHVRNQVNQELKRRYNRPDVPSTILDRVVKTKTYRHAGGPEEDVGDIVDRALIQLMKDAHKVWNEDLSHGADYDIVIITGGGGPIIGPLLMPQLQHRNVRIVPEGEAHLANAVGALRHRKFKREYVRSR